jgi:hypothetical protein
MKNPVPSTIGLSLRNLPPGKSDGVRLSITGLAVNDATSGGFPEEAQPFLDGATAVVVMERANKSYAPYNAGEIRWPRRRRV